ncbi:hypothetical protein [Embleya hyalina]|uniref:Uncharacterized protein n=1 Tax=Embleya hyalina TaxID=516124 RepID=A0A401YHY4_9ACTN|nr:hypothetical protein [Embleya hyalina]GCD94197.1 hypothetical protein EHYA_01856 [Embleya hyalina]
MSLVCFAIATPPPAAPSGPPMSAGPFQLPAPLAHVTYVEPFRPVAVAVSVQSFCRARATPPPALVSGEPTAAGAVHQTPA